MKEAIEQIKVEMQKELDAYKASPTTAQPYFVSMKKISDWLKEKS